MVLLFKGIESVSLEAERWQGILATAKLNIAWAFPSLHANHFPPKSSRESRSPGTTSFIFENLHKMSKVDQAKVNWSA